MAPGISIAIGHNGIVRLAINPCPVIGKEPTMHLQLMSSAQSVLLEDLPTAVRVNGSCEPIHSQVIRDLCEGRLCDRRRGIVIGLLQKAGVTGLDITTTDR